MCADISFFTCHIHFILHVKENGRLRGASEGASRGPASTSPVPCATKATRGCNSTPWSARHAPAHPVASGTSAPRPFPVRGSLSPRCPEWPATDSFPIRPFAALRVAWGRRSVSPEPFRHGRMPRVPRGVPVRAPGTVRTARDASRGVPEGWDSPSQWRTRRNGDRKRGSAGSIPAVETIFIPPSPVPVRTGEGPGAGAYGLRWGKGGGRTATGGIRKAPVGAYARRAVGGSRDSRRVRGGRRPGGRGVGK